MGECPDWLPLFEAVEAFGSMGVSVPPWELAKQPEIWGAWAITYQAAKADAAVMRQQIQAARDKNQK